MVFTAVNGSGYTGTKTQKFKISVAKADIGKTPGVNIEFPDGDTFPVVKGGAKPEVVVTYGDIELKKGRDYTVAYSNNRTVDGAKSPLVTVKGKGYFKGKKTAEFTIVSAEQ